MKITKTEKHWLFAVVLFFALYNLPFVPGYGDARGALIHAALTLIPLWICIYVGLRRVFRIYRIRDNRKEG
ncbi:MAG: hypothetical protein KH050_11640 [Clostridiaceae bacterium]|jgi:hypothetical protein|nr:hypothetical protein [Clostridiaceae bacterium]